MKIFTKALVAALFATVASAAYASHTTFDMDSASVKVGDTITFANKDDVTHNINVTSPDGDNDDKGLQKPGQDIKATFAKAGVYKVHCAIHPKMKMEVTVQ